MIYVNLLNHCDMRNSAEVKKSFSCLIGYMLEGGLFKKKNGSSPNEKHKKGVRE